MMCILLRKRRIIVWSTRGTVGGDCCAGGYAGGIVDTFCTGGGANFAVGCVDYRGGLAAEEDVNG